MNPPPQTIDVLCIMLAWQSDRIAEGEAADVLGIDRITLRLFRDAAMARAFAKIEEHSPHGPIEMGQVRRGRPPKAGG